MKEPTFNFELSGYAITQIESPTKENWYDAIKRDPLALRYLDMRHPERRRLEILALELDWMSIKYFRNPANQDIYKSILKSPYAIEQLDMYRKRDLEILVCQFTNWGEDSRYVPKSQRLFEIFKTKFAKANNIRSALKAWESVPDYFWDKLMRIKVLIRVEGLVSNEIVFYGEIGFIRKNLETLYGHYTDYHKIKRNEKWMDQPVTFTRFEM